MLEVKKLSDFMKERNIKDGEKFDQVPFTDWFIFEDCFGYIFGVVDKQGYKENYIVLSDTPKPILRFVNKKYHFEDEEVKENDRRKT